jgi:hypothetical protein
MSKWNEFGEGVANALGVGDSAREVYDAVQAYERNSSVENLANILKIGSTQLAGQLIAKGLDKIAPDSGEKFLWESRRLQDLSATRLLN